MRNMARNISRVSVAAILMLACQPMVRAASGGWAPVLKQTIPLAGVEGRIDHMAIDQKGNRLYVAALGNDTVEVVDLAAGKRVQTLKGFQEPQGITVAPGTRHVVVASGGDGKVRVYDAALKPVARIDHLEDADNVRYDPGSKLAVIGYGSGALLFIDPKSGAKVREIGLDAHPESFQLEEQGSRVFVNVPGAQEIEVVDRSKGTVVARWPLTAARGNFPMALDEADHRLFVGCRRPAKLLVLNTENGKTVAMLDIVRDSDDVYYDTANRQIYITGGGGEITVISRKSADAYAVAGQVTTASGARTSLFSAGSQTLYVAVPHRGSQAAELRVFTIGAAK